MSARPWHRRFHSDALTGYMGLTLEERGAYTTLLDLMYDGGEPLIDNERLLAGHMGVSLRKYRAMRDTLIAKGKIQITDDGHLTNKRFRKERENDAKTSRKLSENGLKGGRKVREPTKNNNKNNGPSKQGLTEGLSLNQKLESRSKNSVPKGTDACASEPTARDRLWEAVTRLAEQRGEDRKPVAAVAGKAVKLAGGDCGAVLTVVESAFAERPISLEPWLLQHFRPRDGPDRFDHPIEVDLSESSSQ